MTYENLLFDTNDGVATITLNRASTYNSLSLNTLQELIAAFKAVKKDANTRAVILTGEGKGFSSGADLMELSQNLAEVDISETLRTGLNTLAQAVRTLEKPVICAVNGVAAGAGASIPLMADYRIASEKASFVFAAFVNIGIVPDAGGTYLLQKLVGPAKALELFLMADAKKPCGCASCAGTWHRQSGGRCG